jgi:hypothetical protein
MWFIGYVFLPRFALFLTELLVEQRRRPSVSSVISESPFVRHDRPLLSLVLDEVAALQTRKRGAHDTVVEFGSACDLARFERSVVVYGKKSEYMVGARELLEVFLARSREGLPIDRHMCM